MADFDFITPRLAVGGCLSTPYQFRDVRCAGFTRVTQVSFPVAHLDSGDAFLAEREATQAPT